MEKIILSLIASFMIWGGAFADNGYPEEHPLTGKSGDLCFQDKMLLMMSIGTYMTYRERDTDERVACIVKAKLKIGMSTNETTVLWGMSPLHLALQVGKYETARVLLDAGANVNAQDEKGNTPLFYAFNAGDIFDLILRKKPDLMIRNKEGANVLSQYITEAMQIYSLTTKENKNKQAEIIKMYGGKKVVRNMLRNSLSKIEILIGAGAKLSEYPVSSQKMIKSVQESGWVELGALFSLSQVVQSQPPSSRQVRENLLLAINSGHIKKVDDIVKGGWLPIVTEDTLWIHQMWVAAARRNRTDVMEVLWGVARHYLDTKTDMADAMHKASGNYAHDVVQYLIDIGVSTEILSSAIEHGVSTGQPKLVQLLIEEGGRPSKEVFYRSISGLKAHMRIFFLLLPFVDDVNFQLENRYGYPSEVSPLMKAASTGNLRYVRALLEKGANPNILDSNGRNVLFYPYDKLISRGKCTSKKRIVEFLLENNADKMVIDNKNYRATDWAKKMGCLEAAKLLN